MSEMNRMSLCRVSAGSRLARRISLLVVAGAIMLSIAAPRKVEAASPRPEERRRQTVTGGHIAGVVPDPLTTYPSCTRARVVSTWRWRLATFERLSIRLPTRFRVLSKAGFDHGGRAWEFDDAEVDIAKLIGVTVEPFTAWESREERRFFTRVRACTTTRLGLTVLIQEFVSERGAQADALFPGLGLALSARSSRGDDLPVLRTIVESARVTAAVIP